MVKKEKTIPLGVKLIAILYYIGAGISAIIGLAVIGIIGLFSGWTIWINTLVVTMMGFVVTNIVIGRGLWKGKEWARITAIVIAGISIAGAIAIIVLDKSISGIFNTDMSNVFDLIINNIINATIQILIGGYLLFSEEAKECFDS